MKRLAIGDGVVFCDRKGVEHKALCIQNWSYHAEYDDGNPPSINLVYVQKDERMKDDYGRQTVKETSVTHQSMQQAPGLSWRLPDEERAHRA